MIALEPFLVMPARQAEGKPACRPRPSVTWAQLSPPRFTRVLIGQLSSDTMGVACILNGAFKTKHEVTSGWKTYVSLLFPRFTSITKTCRNVITP